MNSREVIPQKPLLTSLTDIACQQHHGPVLDLEQAVLTDMLAETGGQAHTHEQLGQPALIVGKLHALLQTDGGTYEDAIEALIETIMFQGARPLIQKTLIRQCFPADISRQNSLSLTVYISPNSA